jgi:hypothetical protein
METKTPMIKEWMVRRGTGELSYGLLPSEGVEASSWLGRKKYNLDNLFMIGVDVWSVCLRRSKDETWGL